MHRVLIDPRHVSGSTITVDDPKALHHLRVVLRLKRGGRVVCFDGQGGEYRGTIRQLSSRRATVSIGRQERRSSPALSIWLIQSLIKRDRFDWVVQKATELGVARLSPVVTQRTVVRISEEQRPYKHRRWCRIAEEAAKQCGRSTLPIIDSPQAFASLLPSLDGVPLVLIPTLAVATKPLRDVLTKAHHPSEIAVLIGPEGDFTYEEVRQAQARKAQPVSLGQLTLRTETASLATIAILRYVLEST